MGKKRANSKLRPKAPEFGVDLPVLFHPIDISDGQGKLVDEFKSLENVVGRGVISVRIVTVNFELLDGIKKNKPTICRLWPNQKEIAELRLWEVDPETGTRTIIGKLVDNPFSEILLVSGTYNELAQDGKRLRQIQLLAGSLDSKDLHLTFRYFEKKYHVESEFSPEIWQHSQLRIPTLRDEEVVIPDCTSCVASPIRDDEISREIAETVNIDVAIFASPAAKSHAGPFCAIWFIAVHCISQVNLAFRNSAINARVRLVTLSLLDDFVESDSSSDMLYNFRTNVKVGELRNDRLADICFLLTKSPDYAPWSNRMEYAQNNGDFEALAFGISDYEQAIANKSFAHEVGHIFGCCHTTEKDNPLFDYAHAYKCKRTSGEYVGTLLATGCERVTYYSSPDICFEGVQMGTAEAHNNAETIRQTMKLVSEFR